MKRFVLLTLVLVFSLPLLAQTSLFEQLTEKYGNTDGFSASRITSDMFDLYLKKRNIDDTSPVSEALKNLDRILVVSQNSFLSTGTVQSQSSGKDDEVAKEIQETILKHYYANDYMLFKTEKKMGEDVKVFLKKNKDKIESLALVTHTPASTNLIELQGDIDLNAVSELNKTLNLRGLENLYKINNSSGYYVGTGVSPNVSYYSQEKMEKMEEMVARQRELAEKQGHLSEEQREKMKEQARHMQEKQEQMAEKYREMAEKYRGQPLFLNYPGDTNTIYIINGKKVDAEEVKKLNPKQIETIEIRGGETDKDATTIKIITKK